MNTNQLKQILEKMGLEEGYKILTEREKQIIYSYYLEGYKDEEIAAFYGITQQVINRLRRKGIAKLKKYKFFLIRCCKITSFLLLLSRRVN